MLKLIASLSMLIDHMGLAFLDSSTTLYLIARCIGRIAMPLFAYKIACGYLYTKNFKKYLSRLLAMTLLAQIPFTWLLYGDTLFSELLPAHGITLLFSYWNIGFTFMIALLVLYVSHHTLGNRFITFITLVILLILSESGDYGLYAVALVSIFYYYERKTLSHVTCSLLVVGISIVSTLSMPSSFMVSTALFYLCSFISLPIIYHIKDTRVPLPRYFFYYFYPLHILGIVLLKQLL